MYDYPLRFKLNVDSPEEPVTILNVKKKEILFRPLQDEAVNLGKTAGIIYAGSEVRQPQYHYLIRNVNGKPDILISTAAELKMGRVIGTGVHRWQILDAQDLPFGDIVEKCTYKKSCLFLFLTVTIWETLARLFFPHRFEVRMRGEKVLVLRESDETFIDDYFLKKKGEYNEREESLLLAGLISVLAVDQEEFEEDA